jgi:hypothetical protein
MCTLLIVIKYSKIRRKYSLTPVYLSKVYVLSDFIIYSEIYQNALIY